MKETKTIPKCCTWQCFSPAALVLRSLAIVKVSGQTSPLSFLRADPFRFRRFRCSLHMSSSSPNSSLYWFPTLLWSSSEKVRRFPCNFFTFVSQFLPIFKSLFAFVSHFLSSVSMGQISFALYLLVSQSFLVFSGSLLGQISFASQKVLWRVPPNCSTHLSPKWLFSSFPSAPDLDWCLRKEHCGFCVAHVSHWHSMRLQKHQKIGCLVGFRTRKPQELSGFLIETLSEIYWIDPLITNYSSTVSYQAFVIKYGYETPFGKKYG